MECRPVGAAWAKRRPLTAGPGNRFFRQGKVEEPGERRMQNIRGEFAFPGDGTGLFAFCAGVGELQFDDRIGLFQHQHFLV